MRPPYFEGGFGDNWHFCSYVLNFSVKNPDATILIDHNLNGRIKYFLKLFKPYFDTKGDFAFEYTGPRKRSTLFIAHTLDWEKLMEHKPLPTKRQWRGAEGTTVCYQFDGNCDAKIKNCGEDEIREFIATVRKLGYIPVDVGHNKPMKKIAEDVCRARFFVGVISGMSILCQSTKTPMYLISNKFPIKTLLKIKKMRYRHAKEQIHWHDNLRDLNRELLKDSSSIIKYL